MKKLTRSAALMAGLLIGTTASAVEIGEAAPQFSLPRLTDNAAVTPLTQFSNKVIYLDFWASWCAPCRTSFPLLNALYQKYQQQGFEVVAVNLDEDLDDAKKFLVEYPVAFTVLRDEPGEWAETYDVESMPTSFIIDKHGTIQRVHNGFAKADIDEIENKIVSLINQP